VTVPGVPVLCEQNVSIYVTNKLTRNNNGGIISVLPYNYFSLLFAMSDYLSRADSSDEEAPVCTLNEVEIAEITANCATLKAEGNACFSAKDYDGALAKYTVGLSLCCCFSTSSSHVSFFGTIGNY